MFGAKKHNINITYGHMTGYHRREIGSLQRSLTVWYSTETEKTHVHKYQWARWGSNPCVCIVCEDRRVPASVRAVTVFAGHQETYLFARKLEHWSYSTPVATECILLVCQTKQFNQYCSASLVMKVTKVL